MAKKPARPFGKSGGMSKGGMSKGGKMSKGC